MNKNAGRLDVGLGSIAWALVSLMFVGSRLSTAIQVPVSGAELSSLAGAWQETLGVADPRFMGSLFQSITSLLLTVNDGAALPRAIAVVASSTIPVGLFLIRRQLGEAAALTALFILAIDPVAVLMGSTASSAALDLAVSVWLLVAMLNGVKHPLLWGVLGLGVVCGGPTPVILAASFGALRLLQRSGVDRAAIAAFAVGGLAGAGLLSVLFGPTELRIPSLDILQAGLTARWAGANVLELTVLYELPVLLVGSAASAHLLARWLIVRDASDAEKLLLVWAAAGGLYWAIALGAADPSPVLALALPLAAVIGSLGPRVLASLSEATETRKFPAISWALIPVSAASVLLLLSGTFAVARGAPNEVLTVPADSASAHALRDHVLALAPANSGGIIVHPDLRAQLTWPMRSSVPLVVSSRVTRGDAVVIWPADETAPEGYSETSGSWLVVREVSAPTNDLGQIASWFRERNRHITGGIAARVYTGVTP